ncbi:MAG: rod shape-determining protein MreC [Acidobacteria bacterium]|nr:rod shape-determining protein MreC [Acidobacteriota bacterium]MBI3426858.1 rod shape-determining protein MreC [Acidobacteriota bacterium]
MQFVDKIKQDATRTLAVLLALHLVAVSFNRTTSHPELYVGQVVVSTILYPFQFFLANGLGSFRKIGNRYFALRDARAENEQLKAQVAQLNQKLLESQDQAKVADQLNTFVKWRSGLNYPALDARVIGRDATAWFNTVVIDQGTLAGVQKDMPVVTPEGLVGRVVFAGPLASRVLLITDERHGAGAIIGQLVNTRLIGVIKGKNNVLCEMRFVGPADKVAAGEAVITSGQDGLYPRGLPLGTVRLTPGAPGVPQTLEIEPAAPLNKLDVVAVLQVPKDQIRAKVDELVQQETAKQQQEKLPGRRRGEAQP